MVQTNAKICRPPDLCLRNTRVFERTSVVW